MLGLILGRLLSSWCPLCRLLLIPLRRSFPPCPAAQELYGNIPGIFVPDVDLTLTTRQACVVETIGGVRLETLGGVHTSIQSRDPQAWCFRRCFLLSRGNVGRSCVSGSCPGFNLWVASRTRFRSLGTWCCLHLSGAILQLQGSIVPVDVSQRDKPPSQHLLTS